MKRVANRDGRDFGREVAHATVSRRPPIPPRHDSSPCSHVHVRRESSGFVPRSRAVFRRAVPNPKRYDSRRVRRCTSTGVRPPGDRPEPRGACEPKHTPATVGIRDSLCACCAVGVHLRWRRRAQCVAWAGEGAARLTPSHPLSMLFPCYFPILYNLLSKSRNNAQFAARSAASISLVARREPNSRPDRKGKVIEQAEPISAD
jgi:hypothetical protein